MNLIKICILFFIGYSCSLKICAEPGDAYGYAQRSENNPLNSLGLVKNPSRSTQPSQNPLNARYQKYLVPQYQVPQNPLLPPRVRSKNTAESRVDFSEQPVWPSTQKRNSDVGLSDETLAEHQAMDKPLSAFPELPPRPTELRRNSSITSMNDVQWAKPKPAQSSRTSIGSRFKNALPSRKVSPANKYNKNK